MKSKLTLDRDLLSRGNTLRNYLILGVLIRVALAPFLGHFYDIYVWEWVFKDFLRGIDVYTGWDSFVAFHRAAATSLEDTATFHEYSYYAYPPLWAITIILSCLPMLITGFNPFLFRLLVKLPLIAGDILVAYLLYTYFTNRGSKDIAEKSFKVLMLSPITILISAVWGMFDILPALFCLLAYLLLLQKHSNWSAVALALSINYKMYALFLLPLFAFYLPKLREKVRYIEIAVIINVIICTPFILLAGSSFFNFFTYHNLERVADGLTFQSIKPTLEYFFTVYAFSFLNSLLEEAASPTVFAILGNIGKVLFYGILGIIGVIYIFVEENKQSEETLLTYTILMLLVMLFANPVVHEQFLLWILPFMMIYIANYGNKAVTKSWNNIIRIWLVYTICNSGFVRFIPMDVWTMLTGQTMATSSTAAFNSMKVSAGTLEALLMRTVTSGIIIGFYILCVAFTVYNVQLFIRIGQNLATRRAIIAMTLPEYLNYKVQEQITSDLNIGRIKNISQTM